MKGEDFPQLSDPEWIANLAFLVDIMKHLNKLNLRLQGKDQLVNILFGNILVFEDQLKDMEKEIARRDFKSFPSLQANPPSGISVPMAFMIGLREQFASRFSDLRAHANKFEFFWPSLQ